MTNLCEQPAGTLFYQLLVMYPASMHVDLINIVYLIAVIFTGFIQGSLNKIQGLFKDFSRLFYSFQGLKV